MGYWVYLQAKQEPDRRHRTSWHIVVKRVTCNGRSHHGDRACFLLDEVLLGLANPLDSDSCRMIAITTIISGPGTFYQQSYFAIVFQRILSTNMIIYYWTCFNFFLFDFHFNFLAIQWKFFNFFSILWLFFSLFDPPSSLKWFVSWFLYLFLQHLVLAHHFCQLTNLICRYDFSILLFDRNTLKLIVCM